MRIRKQHACQETLSFTPVHTLLVKEVPWYQGMECEHACMSVCIHIYKYICACVRPPKSPGAEHEFFRTASTPLKGGCAPEADRHTHTQRERESVCVCMFVHEWLKE